MYKLHLIPICLMVGAIIGLHSLACKDNEIRSSASNNASSLPTNSQNSEANFALLVGINQYPNLEKRYQLNGCVNDVKLMKTLLVEVFEFDSTNNIKLLLNKQATRQNILDAFENFLIKNARKDGQVLFYYSGHGSRMTDLNFDEADTLDETIVPHDSRDPDGKVIDISDDELNTLLTKLSQRCQNVTVITDCCNSGSGVRGETAVPRLAPELRLNKPITPSGKRVKEGTSGFFPQNSNYLHISACRDREYAYERDGYGALTRALNEVIRKNPRTTYRNMMYEVYEKVNTLQSSQHPQIEGPRRDAPIFGNLGKVEKFVEVAAVAGNKIRLKAGQAHGVTAGSIYEIYQPGTNSKDQVENYLGRAQITFVDPFSSVAEVSEKKAEIPINAAAFELAHHYGDLQLKVFLDLHEELALQQEIIAALQAYKRREDLVKLAAKDEGYEVRIRLSEDGARVLIEQPDLTVLKQIDRDTLNIHDDLLKVLSKEARRLNVLRLENKNSRLKTTIKILQCWEKAEEDIRGNRYPVNPLPKPFAEIEGGQRLFYAGNVIELSFRNDSPKALHIYLLDIATDGGVYLIYPASGAQDSPLAPGDSIKNILEITPPEGLNSIKLIATTRKTDFWALTQSGYRSIGAVPDSPLGQLLNLAWGGTRNVNTIEAKDIGDWNTKMISFLIKNP